jgi:hypothetical protein
MLAVLFAVLLAVLARTHACAAVICTHARATYAHVPHAAIYMLMHA